MKMWVIENAELFSMEKSFLVARDFAYKLPGIDDCTNPDDFAALDFQGRGRFFNELQLLRKITSANRPTKIVFHATIAIAMARLCVHNNAN